MTRVRYSGGPLDGLTQELGRDLEPGQWASHITDTPDWTGRCLYLAVQPKPGQLLMLQFRGITCGCIVPSPRGVSALCGLIAGHRGTCYGHTEVITEARDRLLKQVEPIARQRLLEYDPDAVLEQMAPGCTQPVEPREHVVNRDQPAPDDEGEPELRNERVVAAAKRLGEIVERR